MRSFVLAPIVCISFLTLCRCRHASGTSTRTSRTSPTAPNADPDFVENIVPALTEVVATRNYQSLVPPEGVEVIGHPHDGTEFRERIHALNEETRLSSEEGTPAFQVVVFRDLLEQVQSPHKSESVHCEARVCWVHGGEVSYTGSLSFDWRAHHLFLKSIQITCGGAHIERE